MPIHPWWFVVGIFTALWCLAYVIVLFKNPSTARALIAAVAGAVTTMLMFLAYGIL